MPIEKQRALALVIGVNQYDHARRLQYAVKDAADMTSQLRELGFTVIHCLDRSHKEIQDEIIKFEAELKNFDFGLFYYAGHGVQLADGNNYLFGKDTRIDSETAIELTSIKLNDLLRYMHTAQTKLNIVILDACRNNPFLGKHRAVAERGLAAVFAPKGTIIAFSTSPGETASDVGTGENGLYTECLLRHITDKNVPIEEFLKRVRTSVYELSGGTQTSWEHTSMIGDFRFNSGNLVPSANLPYSLNVIADGEYMPDVSAFGDVIEKLKSHTWDSQNRGIDYFRRIPAGDLSLDQLFLFGRNLLQAACGNAFAATNIFENLGQSLDPYGQDGENHILNGILFETYFNHGGQFRQGAFKSSFIEQIFHLRSSHRYHKAFEFIIAQLSSFTDFVFYMPTIPEISLPVELGILKQEHMSPWPGGRDYMAYTLVSVKIAGAELLAHKVTGIFDGIQQQWKRFLDDLSRRLCVPLSLMTISANIHPTEITTLTYPYPLTLSKNTPLI